MTQKTIGYVELEWTCGRCGTKNPGTRKKCVACGAPMGESDQFDLPEQGELISDEEKLEGAKRGPDVHCPYCGARNPAGAEKCKQCSAPLGDAKARESGKVLGAYKAGVAPDVACPFCGTKNPANASKCTKCGGSLAKKPKAEREAKPHPAVPKKKSKAGLGIFGGLFGIVACIAVILFFVLGSRTTDTWGMVQSVSWERSIPIMEQRLAEHEDWRDEIPAGAQLGVCEEKYRSTQPESTAGAREVCGTPYTIDQGSGTGKVVQDCEYEIWEDWCVYSVSEWQVVDRSIAQGVDLSPRWPDLALSSAQREGEKRAEKYIVTFKTDDKRGRYTYSVDTAQEFAQFTIGSEWILKINTFGDVTDATPAK